MYNWRVVYYRFVTDHRGHNRTQTSHWVFLLAILFSWSDNRAPCAVGMEKWNFLMSLLHLLSTMLCKHYPTIYNTYNLHEHTITRSTLDNTYSTTPPPALPPIDLPDACLKLGVHWTTPAHLTLEVHWTTPTVQPSHRSCLKLQVGVHWTTPTLQYNPLIDLPDACLTTQVLNVHLHEQNWSHTKVVKAYVS